MRQLRTRHRWLSFKLRLAELFIPRIPAARPLFSALSTEAENLLADAETHLRQCEQAAHDV